MMRVTVGEYGLGVALRLYGAECVVDAGSWLSTAVINIPQEDYETFKVLEAEFRAELKGEFLKDKLKANIVLAY